MQSFGGWSESESEIYLNQEELQKILEKQGEEASSGVSESTEFSTIATNIFDLRGKKIQQILQPLEQVQSLPSNATIEEMKEKLIKADVDYLLIYHHETSNIIGIAYPHAAVRAAGTKRIRDYMLPPWFVSETMSIMQILKQFRSNNESLAVILNNQGKAIGIVTLDDVLEEIFGKLSARSSLTDISKKSCLLKRHVLPQ